MDKKNKTKGYHLSIADFVIKINLKPTQHIQYRKLFEDSIENIWGKGGFLLKGKKKSDFEIEITSEDEGIPFIEKGKESYYFSWKLDKAAKKARTYYHLSPLLLGNLIREILMNLLRGGGLIIHASSCVDKKGVIYIFMAPSKGGKTTTVDLLDGLKDFKKVGDDLFIARRFKKGWRFYSPPIIEKESLPTFSWNSKAKIFFVKKAKKCSKRKLEKRGLLKVFLPQVWLRQGKIDKETLSISSKFIEENNFFELKNCLDPKKLKEVVS